MGYVEYIKPDPKLKADVENVLSVGLDKGTEEGLLERARSFKSMIEKWDGRLSGGFVKKVNEIINLAAIPVDKLGRPHLPDYKAYTSLEEYAGAVKEAWELRDEFDKNKEIAKKLPSIDTGDRFVMMTDRIRYLLSILTFKDFSTVEVRGVLYNISPSDLWPGHAICQVLNKDHIKFFQDISQNTNRNIVDMARHIYWEELPIKKKTGESSEKTEKTKAENKKAKTQQKKNKETVPKEVVNDVERTPEQVSY